MDYFRDYAEAISSADLTPVAVRALATEGPELSFAHLDDRTFEILVYRLKARQAATTKDRVTLMQGAGERGRDILTYGSDGHLKTIVQCKLLKERLSYPELARELLKLSIHRCLDAHIVASGVVYEIWAPSGFSEPAAELIDTWPRGWTEGRLRSMAESVIGSYTAFSGLSWGSVKEAVLQFSSLVTVQKLASVDISVLVRTAPEVFDDFFVARKVVDLADLRRVLSTIVEDATASARNPSTEGGVGAVGDEPSTVKFFQPPPPSGNFTGRDALRSAVHTALDSQRIAVVAGAGGIGKSAIAACVARELELRGRTTLWLDGQHLQQQLGMLGYTFGVRWEPTQSGPLQARLEACNACIIIDGLSFTPDVRGMPRPSEKLGIVITTRERGILPLLPHDSTLIDVSVLPLDEARLLVRRGVGVALTWTDDEIDRVAIACGLYPLALVLLVSTLRREVADCDILMKELNSSPIETLDAISSVDQPGIEVTFAVAMARLSLAERSTLVGLAVCAPGTWMEVVALAAKRPKHIVEQSLEALHAISLVERHPNLPLWTMHDVVRFMCLRHPDAAIFAMRHDVAAMRQIETHQRPEDWAIVEANLGEILVAADRLVTLGLAEEVGSVVRLLIPHLRERGVHRGRQRIIRDLSSRILPLLPRKSMAYAYFVGQLGLCSFDEGDLAGAERQLQQSLRLYRSLRSKEGEVSTLANLAHLDEAAGKLDRAATRYRQSAERRQTTLKTASKRDKLEHRRHSLIGRLHLARVEAMRGDLKACLREVERMLRATTTPDLLDLRARALRYKAKALSELGRVDESLEVGREAVQLLKQVGLANELLQALVQFACTALAGGYLSNVLQAAEHAITVAEALEDWGDVSFALSLQARALSGLDRDDEAAVKRAKARDMAQRTADPTAALARIDRLEHSIAFESLG